MNELPCQVCKTLQEKQMSKLRKILKTVISPFLKTGAKIYYTKPRKFSYKNIEVLVHPEVFPPHLTLSTKILLDFISEIDLQNKTFLELGCGSGIISLYASKKEAIVTATDVNEIALKYLEEASKKQHLKLQCVASNLFENISEKYFDYIIINPPYYPKNPESIKEQAWYCGEDFEYFKNLFKQLPIYLSEENNTFMILSEDCDIKKIKNIATQNNIDFQKVFSIKKVGELNIIFQLTTKQNDK